MASPEIVLYTNHNCPWAHRAHIALAELGLPFQEEIVDLSIPRTQEYLKINPRGLVPALVYDGEIITESGIVAQFLADAHPSHLLPASNAAGGALRRARIDFFVDAFISKANSQVFKVYSSNVESEWEAAGVAYVEAVVKEVEPLLSDAAPFFGGSNKLTLAEVQTGSFILRLYSLAKYGVLPQSFVKDLPQKAPNFYKWSQEVIRHPSVNGIYNEERVVEGTKARLAKMRA